MAGSILLKATCCICIPSMSSFIFLFNLQHGKGCFMFVTGGAFGFVGSTWCNSWRLAASDLFFPATFVYKQVIFSLSSMHDSYIFNFPCRHDARRILSEDRSDEVATGSLTMLDFFVQKTKIGFATLEENLKVQLWI